MASELAERRDRVLHLRSLGFPYADIAARDGVGGTPKRAQADAAALLQARAMSLEPAVLADALALERLDRLERRVNTVIRRAAESGNHDLALRATDRLLLIHERRAQVLPQRPEPGEMERAVAAEVGTYPDDVRSGPAAVAAVLLARRLDAGLPSQDLAGVAREIRITLRVLEGKAPKQPESSTRDDLRARREQRLTAEVASR